MEIFSFTAESPEDLPPLAQKLLATFPEEKLFAFFAPMGAGKTTFIKALGVELGVLDRVLSPTFAIVNEYKTQDKGPVFHFDFYRLKNLEEAMDIGCDEYFFSGSYCFLEWSEIVEPILPDKYVRVDICTDDSQKRYISAQVVRS